MEKRLAGFVPRGLGFAGDGRILEVWVDGHAVAYFVRLDRGRRTACIISPKILDFTWVTAMPVGEPS